MKKSLLVASALLLAGGVSAQADALGGEIAIGGWNHDPSGWIKYPNYLGDENKLDADSDLNLDTETDLYLRAKLEHPIPIVPNVRVSYVRTASSGDGTISKNFTFGDITFGANEKVHTEAQLDQYDGTLYYEVVDMEKVDLDVGLTVRYIDGYVEVTSRTTGLSDRADISQAVPMLYANARLPIPLLEGLSVGAEGNWISYDGSTLYDIQGDLRYTFLGGLGAEAGYRWQKIKLDDVDDTDADIDLKGFYMGLVWDF
ncbi:TIGR04219 family outer membrane beta-barrel protein [Hydrogenimonas sp.]